MSIGCEDMLGISLSGVIALNGIVKQCLVICLHTMRTSTGSIEELEGSSIARALN